MSASIIRFVQCSFSSELSFTPTPGMSVSLQLSNEWGRDKGKVERAVACVELSTRRWLCVSAVDAQEQLAIEARLERKRFRRSRSQGTPPAA